jgi:hypothetical protein
MSSDPACYPLLMQSPGLLHEIEALEQALLELADFRKVPQEHQLLLAPKLHPVALEKVKARTSALLAVLNGEHAVLRIRLLERWSE